MAYEFPPSPVIGQQEVVGSITFQYDGDDAEGNNIWNIVPGATSGFDPDASYTTTGDWINTGSWRFSLGGGDAFAVTDVENPDIVPPEYGLIVFDDSIQFGATDVNITANFVTGGSCGADYGYAHDIDASLLGRAYGDVTLLATGYDSMGGIPPAVVSPRGNIIMNTNTTEPDGGSVFVNGREVCTVEKGENIDGEYAILYDSRGNIIECQQAVRLVTPAVVANPIPFPLDWSTLGITDYKGSITISSAVGLPPTSHPLPAWESAVSTSTEFYAVINDASVGVGTYIAGQIDCIFRGQP